MLNFLYWWYSVWMALLFFLLTPFMLLGYLVVLLLPYRRQIHGVYVVNRSFLFVWSVLTFTRYSIKGLEHINKNQSYVVVVNHTNSADLIAMAYGGRILAKPLVKKELTLIPFLGQLFSLGCISVDRGSKEGRKHSKDRMLHDLQLGISVLLFPEGTRNRTNLPLKDFYDGAFDLAVAGQLPILPILLTNISKLNPKRNLIFQPKPIEINHLAAIYPNGTGDEAVQQLKTKVFNTMWNYLVDNDDAFKNQEKR